MIGFIVWLIVGLLAGALARFLIPGRQPMTIFVTMLLGLIGSIVGGLVSAVLFGQDPMNPGFHPAGLVMSTIGAVIALLIYSSMIRRSAAPPRI